VRSNRPMQYLFKLTLLQIPQIDQCLLRFSKALFGSLEEALGKKGRSEWKKHRTLRGESFGGIHFFKFNLCRYNILNIKNLLIISINLTLSNKILIQKNVKDFSIFHHPPIGLPSPPNSQTKPKWLIFNRELLISVLKGIDSKIKIICKCIFWNHSIYWIHYLFNEKFLLVNSLIHISKPYSKTIKWYNNGRK